MLLFIKTLFVLMYIHMWQVVPKLLSAPLDCENRFCSTHTGDFGLHLGLGSDTDPVREIMTDAKATTTPLRVGIMGTANIARKNIAAIRVASGVEVVAVGSRSAARATTYAEENDLDPATCACYGSYQELLDSPNVDAVYIPLPTALHAEWAPKAALAGKHVLCEKPLARDAAELQTILASFDENSGLVFMDGVMFMVRDTVCGSRRVAWCEAVRGGCVPCVVCGVPCVVCGVGGWRHFRTGAINTVGMQM